MNETVIQINGGNFTNAFLIRGSAGCVLVDAGNPGKADFILERLAGHTLLKEIRLILITHGHVDHFGSAKELRERTGAPVAIHVLDSGAARQGVNQPDSLRPTSRLMDFLMRIPLPLFPDRAPAFEPDISLESAYRLDEFGVAGWVIPTPGHTPGSVSVLLDSGEAIVGDMVMGRLMGLIRKPGPPIVAWDLERNWESLRQLLALAPRVVYAGHGGPFEDLTELGKVAVERG